MASVARAIQQAAVSEVDKTLWWDSHESLFHLVDDFVSGSQNLSPNQVVENLKVNHPWLLDSLLRFRQPDGKSRNALDNTQVVIGDHKMDIKSELKNMALRASKQLMLNEVQSYILVSRCYNEDEAPSLSLKDFQKITLKYYAERLCLLKCIRLLVLSQMGDPTFKALEIVVNSLLKEGLEDKLLSLLEMLLTVEQPLDMDVMFISLWAEQIAREIHLILDTTFLLYFKPLCSCSFKRWKNLFLVFKENVFVGTNVQRLSLTPEATDLIEHLKHQCLLILLETLDLDKLLLMVHENMPFSHNGHLFGVSDLQQIEELMGELDAIEVQDYAPLLLGWGIFGCLLSFLPKPVRGILELNHASHSHQAYGAGALKYVLHILHHKLMKETLVDGYKFVIKSLISAFVAAYDIINQNDTAAMDTVIDILSLVHSGQEMICTEFWDRENILDGPLRNLLYSLRQLFPYRMKSLVVLLSGLTAGSWAAECVYNFLHRPAKIACIYEESGNILNSNEQIVTAMTLPVPKISGLLIPSGTTGQCLKILDGQKCLVLWNCKHSGVVSLLLHLVDLIGTRDSWEDIHAIVSLVHHMILSNKMLAKELLELDKSEFCKKERSDGHIAATASIDILVVLHFLIEKLLDVRGHNVTAALCISIFGVFTDCCPMKVTLELKKPLSVWSCNPAENGLLTKLLDVCQDLEGTVGKQVLLMSVLDLCLPMVRKGGYSEGLHKIVIHIIGTVFLNHITWKYEKKHECWQITAKIFELAHTVISNAHLSFSQLRERVMDFMIMDGAFHNVIIRVLSVGIADIQGLYFNRFVEPLEIEWFEASLTQGFLLLHLALSKFLASFTVTESKSHTPLENVLLHHAFGTMPFIGCVASLVGYGHNQTIQFASLKVLKVLCIVAGKSVPQALSVSSYFQGVGQKQQLQMVMGKMLSKEGFESNTQLFNHSLELLETAAIYQPSFVKMLLLPIKEEDAIEGQPDRGSLSQVTQDGKCGSAVFNSIWTVLTQHDGSFERQPNILCRLLMFLRTLWEGASELSDILELLRKRPLFWTVLRSFISSAPIIFRGLDELPARRFQNQCEAYVLQIMTSELFLERERVMQTNDVKSGRPGGHLTNSDLQKTKSGVISSIVQIVQGSDPAKLIQAFAIPHYDKHVALRAKAEMRVLLVGLMLKVLLEDELGLSAGFLECTQSSLRAVFSHSSFQKLSSTYLSQGYGCGRGLQILVISDLYYHLQGELEAGRHIPAGLFEDLVQFLDALDTNDIFSKQRTVIEGLHFEGAWIYDIEMIKDQLGLEWWLENSSQIAQTAKNTLNAMEQANLMTSFGYSQISALEAMSSLLTFLFSDSHLVDLELKLTSKVSFLVEACNSIELTTSLLGPDGDPSELLQIYSSRQINLLLGLLRWLLNPGKQEPVNVLVEKSCMKVATTLVQAVKTASTFQIAEKTVRIQLTRRSLTAFLCCLELLQAQIDRTVFQRSDSDLANNYDSLLVLDSTSSCADFLPYVCYLVENRCLANLAMSVISILIKNFLTPEMWLPVLQRHSTVGHALSILQTSEDTESAFQVLNLLLSLSHLSCGVEMLDSANAFSYLLMFSEKLKEQLSQNDGHGPFSMWNRRTRRHDLWGLCAAIFASFVQTLGKSTKEQAVDIAFAFLDSQREQILHALHSPGSLNVGRHAIKRCGISETTLASLLETHHVLHILVVLMRYHAQWSQVIGASEGRLMQRCIHLLAYIAREGFVCDTNTTVKGSFHCYPVTKEEYYSHRSPSHLNITKGWFGLSARGVVFTGGFSEFEAKSGVSIMARTMSSEQHETETTVPTCYSDSIGLYVYRISLLLLELMYKQAHHIAVSIHEGREQYSNISPELPSPEILHGLQDQVMEVLKEICHFESTTFRIKEFQQVCSVLFLVLEKALILETLVTRICRLGPFYSRAEDFLRDYKALLSVCEGQQFLHTSLKALKPVVSVAFPAVS